MMGVCPARRASWIAREGRCGVSGRPGCEGGKGPGRGLTDLSQRRGAADDEGGRTGVCGLALGFPDGLEAEGEVLRGWGLVVEGQDVGGERERKRRRFFERDVVRNLEGDSLVAALGPG